MQQTSPESQGFSSDRLTRIGRKVDSYIADDKLAGALTMIARRGEIVHCETRGMRDIANNAPVERNTLWRIYSMSKPITSVALMMLYEQGALTLADPVSMYLPAFKDVQVIEDGKLVPCESEMTIQQLLSHSAGLSYGDHDANLEGVEAVTDDDKPSFDKTIDSAEFARRAAKMHLPHQPGSIWRYSIATDLVGCIVEAISGQKLGDFFEEHICAPLGMTDTFFNVPPEKADRFAVLYGVVGDDYLNPNIEQMINADFHNGVFQSGGGGLVSTADDYMRFCQMLLNKGELDGVRILGRRTVELMSRNHLGDHLLPWSLGNSNPGLGFGLGFSVVMDAGRAGTMESDGSFSWGGWARTTFWIDPVEEIIGLQMIQHISEKGHPFPEEFKQMVYQALVD